MAIAHRRVVAKRRDRLVDHPRLEQRLVALHVDDELAVERGGDLREPVGAAPVVRRVIIARAAERLHRRDDPLVVGRDDHGVDGARLGGAAVHVLDHRATADVGERLAGKPGRLVAGGDDGEGAAGVTGCGLRSGSNRVHVES